MLRWFVGKVDVFSLQFQECFMSEIVALEKILLITFSS